jgi:hypothetical protein
MRGRKPKYESRATEFRRRLIVWKQTPKSMRPSLRALAREIGTSHQLLEHYLKGLEEWQYKEHFRQAKEALEGILARAQAENRFVTPWENQQFCALAREALRAMVTPVLLKPAPMYQTGCKTRPVARGADQDAKAACARGISGSKGALEEVLAK